MKEVYLNTPLKDNDLKDLCVGDMVYLSGVIYCARDAAHKKFQQAWDDNKQIPFDVKGQIIYYVGPTPTREGFIIGSAGPTTSYRMDVYMEKLLSMGLKATIGKGNRSQQTIDLMKKYKAVYFAAIGGTGALLSEKITEVKTIAYEELITEAVRKIVVKDFPVIVVNDINGNDLMIEGQNKYKK